MCVYYVLFVNCCIVCLMCVVYVVYVGMMCFISSGFVCFVMYFWYSFVVSDMV